MSYYPYEPLHLNEGNLLGGGFLGENGVTELLASEIRFTPIEEEEQKNLSSEENLVTVYWQERQGSSKKTCRKRFKKEPALELNVRNISDSPGALCVSLPSSVCPKRLDGRLLSTGTFTRLELPRDCTSNLPVSLGLEVRYCTITAAIPSKQNATLLFATADADNGDRHQGFVYQAGVEVPYTLPEWNPKHVLGFPLGANALCSQGFGGKGK